MPRGARFLSLEGRSLPGIRQTVPVAQPAAGQDWNVVVPGGQEWRVLTVRAKLTADATVGNRTPKLVIGNQDGLQVWRSGDAFNLAASSNVTVFAAVYSAPAVSAVSGGYINLVLPPIWLPGSWAFGTGFDLIGATDQWSNITLWVEQLYSTDAILSEG